MNNVVAFNATMGIRSFFPNWVLQPEGNEAYSNVGFGNPRGDFSTSGKEEESTTPTATSCPTRLFHDLEGHDFRLLAQEPRDRSRHVCLVPDPDFEGSLRPLGPMPDIGAFESF